jgi:hypothetical protein
VGTTLRRVNPDENFSKLQEEAKQAARSLLSVSGAVGFLLNLEEAPNGHVLIVAKREDVETLLLSSVSPPQTTH